MGYFRILIAGVLCLSCTHVYPQTTECPIAEDPTKFPQYNTLTGMEIAVGKTVTTLTFSFCNKLRYYTNVQQQNHTFSLSFENTKIIALFNVKKLIESYSSQLNAFGINNIDISLINTNNTQLYTLVTTIAFNVLRTTPINNKFQITSSLSKNGTTLTVSIMRKNFNDWIQPQKAEGFPSLQKKELL